MKHLKINVPNKIIFHKNLCLLKKVYCPFVYYNIQTSTNVYENPMKNCQGTPNFTQKYFEIDIIIQLMQSSTGSYLNFVIILAEKELIETPIKIINNNGLKEKVENVKTKYIFLKTKKLSGNIIFN